MTFDSYPLHDRSLVLARLPDEHDRAFAAGFLWLLGRKHADKMKKTKKSPSLRARFGNQADAAKFFNVQTSQVGRACKKKELRKLAEIVVDEENCQHSQALTHATLEDDLDRLLDQLKSRTFDAMPTWSTTVGRLTTTLPKKVVKDFLKRVGVVGGLPGVPTTHQKIKSSGGVAFVKAWAKEREEVYIYDNRTGNAVKKPLPYSDVRRVWEPPLAHLTAVALPRPFASWRPPEESLSSVELCCGTAGVSHHLRLRDVVKEVTAVDRRFYKKSRLKKSDMTLMDIFQVNRARMERWASALVLFISLPCLTWSKLAADKHGRCFETSMMATSEEGRRMDAITECLLEWIRHVKKCGRVQYVIFEVPEGPFEQLQRFVNLFRLLQVTPVRVSWCHFSLKKRDFKKNTVLFTNVPTLHEFGPRHLCSPRRNKKTGRKSICSMNGALHKDVRAANTKKECTHYPPLLSEWIANMVSLQLLRDSGDEDSVQAFKRDWGYYRVGHVWASDGYYEMHTNLDNRSDMQRKKAAEGKKKRKKRERSRKRTRWESPGQTTSVEEAQVLRAYNLRSRNL